MALPSGNYRRLLVASLATIALLAVSLGPVLAQDLAGNGGDLGELMGRLFGLVKRGYAEIATLDAQLRQTDDQAAREELETELAEKMAEFHERNAKVMAKIPGVEKARPSLSATLANYEEEIGGMEKQVTALARQAELQIRVSDLRLAMRAEQQAERGAANEDNGWEVTRGGSPPPMLVARRQAPVRNRRVAAALPESAADENEDPAPDAAPDPVAEPAPAPDQASVTAEARARVAALRPRKVSNASAPVAVAEADPADDPAAAQAGTDTREAIAEILKRFRKNTSNKQVNLAVNPSPGRINPDLGSPSMPPATARTGAKAAAKAKLTEVVFPVALEIRDSFDRPISRRPVEFVLESTAAPFKANLVDGTAHVQADSLVQLTDDNGIARVDMRLTGPSRPVRVVRTVEPQADRTICHLKVLP
jgi:hypothetical protein